MADSLKDVLKRMLLTALSLSLVITFVPMLAGALTQDVTTAKGNETSTGNVLGGMPTRVTWESVVDKGESVKSITVQFPEGSDLTSETTARLTVLNGVERLEVDAEPVIDTEGENVTVDFAQPLEAGLRVRIETYNACLPNVSGEVTLSGTYTRDNGEVEQLPESPSIEVTQASLAQKIVSWMDEQPFIEAWNSVTVLRLFLEPQLIVSSIPTVFTGWLISLALVLVGFPLAIPIGLASAFMKISRSRVMHVLAAIYTGVVRGTPLFLQIYIAFFGLPLMGINLNEYLLAVLVMAFNSGAYMCEILRAGIQSIPKGQFEASRSLGMTQAQTMFSVIIPQTIRRVIPTMTSEFILLYKDTSLLAAVGVMELMLYSRSVVALTGNMTPYIVAAFFYLIVTLPLIRVVTMLEDRLALADNGGGAPKPKAKRKGLFGGAKKKAAVAAEPAAEGQSAEEKGADRD
ncbi:MAG: ABC transporter permease subunit [Coriobacteriia bacterium]|nr:ABC transporter permease subunit [Coriobacteriia bacterium]